MHFHLFSDCDTEIKNNVEPDIYEKWSELGNFFNVDWSKTKGYEFWDMNTTPNKNLWKGQWDKKTGDVTGYGIWISIDRTKMYQGTMVKEQPYGWGRLITFEGDVYEGDFIGGKYDGKGHFMKWDGHEYKGDFRKGHFHGQGTQTDTNTKVVFVGTFENGKKSGKGLITYPDGMTFEGTWADDKKTGKGLYKKQNPKGLEEFHYMEGLEHGWFKIVRTGGYE